uniref:Uncharacterized protein n=1 Tax=Rhizophora mucronata TaxID=61149 RepID=A0A2P2N274_RHIMU
MNLIVQQNTITCTRPPNYSKTNVGLVHLNWSILNFTRTHRTAHHALRGSLSSCFTNEDLKS